MSLKLRDRPMEFLDQTIVQGLDGQALMLRRYQPGDEDRITLRPDFRHALDAAGGELPPGPRWTLAVWAPNQPLAVGGLEPLGAGVFGAWGLSADLPPRAWAFVRRCARRVLDLAERDLGAREIKAMACDTDAAYGLMRQLGFERSANTVLGPDNELYIPMIRRF